MIHAIFISKEPDLIGKAGRLYFGFNQIDRESITAANLGSLRIKSPGSGRIEGSGLRSVRDFYEEYRDGK